MPTCFLDYELEQLWDMAFRFLVAHLLGIIITGLQPPRQRMPVLLAFIVDFVAWNVQDLPSIAARGTHASPG